MTWMSKRDMLRGMSENFRIADVFGKTVNSSITTFCPRPYGTCTCALLTHRNRTTARQLLPFVGLLLSTGFISKQRLTYLLLRLWRSTIHQYPLQNPRETRSTNALKNQLAFLLNSTSLTKQANSVHY